MSKNNKPKGTRSHPYSSYLKEIRPTWKKNPDMVKAMIKDMVEKKGMLIDRPDLMEFVERFLRLHKNRILQINPEVFDDVQLWATRQTIQYYVELFSWFTMNRYQDKYWVTKDYHLRFIDEKLELMKKRFLFDDNEVSYQKKKIEVLEQFRNGIYPDTKIYDPYLIAIVLEMIVHEDFLKAEKKRLMKSERPTMARVPVELKTDERTHQDYLHVSIPPDFFKAIQKDAIREELKSFQIPSYSSPPKPKFYTRKETSELMQVSLPTLDEMTKQGTITCHRIGDTALKRYRWEDIQDALVKIETTIRRKPY